MSVYGVIRASDHICGEVNGVTGSLVSAVDRERHSHSSITVYVHTVGDLGWC